jgi:predicted Rossmann fold nucleotide-binding protein DprA/Smf involved in DNA uptake
VVPHSPWNKHGSGWVEEHRLGAGLVSSSRDVLEALDRLNLHAIPVAPGGTSQLSLPVEGPLRWRVVASLSGSALHLDELVERCGAPSPEVHAMVAELCLEGVISLGALGVVTLAKEL